ncbi:MAG: ComEC family competence protein [Ruminococcus albus]|nr:ComEC family competence protein [Ruminococcus albus]
MTRKAAWAGFSFWAAMLLSAAYRSELNITLLLTAIGLAVLCFGAFKKYRRQAVVCLVSFAVGIALNTAYTRFVYDKLTALDGQTVTIKGYIKDLSQIDGNYDRVTVSGRIDGLPAEMSFVLPYDDFRYYDEITVTDTVSLLEDGVKFDSGSYNYSKSVFLQGGYATGSAVLTGKSVNPLFRVIREYRDRLFTLIIDTCPEREGAFLGAMLCGDKSELSPALKTKLYRSGLGHIFAVSGIHLVIAVTFFGAVAERLIKSRRISDGLILAEIWGFAVFAGLSVSVVRSAVMLTLTRSGHFFGRKTDGLNSLGLCAIILTAAKPYTAISPSFVLSFLAVLAIELVSLNKGDDEERKPERSLRVSSAVLFTTSPASAAFFGGVSVMSVLTNLFLVPLCTVSLQLSFAVLLTGGTSLVGRPLVKLAALPVRFVLFCADYLADIRYSYIFTSPKFVFWLVIVTSAVMTVVCVFQKNSRRYLLTVMAVIAVWCAAANITLWADDSVKITILPDGRKTAYVVSKQGSAVIFDVGAKGRLDGAVVRQLDSLGVTDISCAFISEQPALTASAYGEDFCFPPKTVFAESDPLTDDAENIIELGQGDIADLDMITVSPADKGYAVTADGNSYIFGKGKVSINGEEVNISDERTALVLDGTTLRRQ